jgi:hypothetical protein
MTDNEWLDHLRAECAKAIAEHLQKAVNIDRPIRSLSRAEMLGIAEAATARWIVLTSQRMSEPREELTEAMKEQIAMLMAG